MAVFFWITIWQFASMYLGQEILLASPGFVRIVTGFLLAMFLGIFLAVLAYWSKTVEILIAPVIAVVKSTPVASFIILCLIWIPSRNLSVFISFLMVLPYFLSACRLSLGMCWKAGVAAEVIGVPSGSIGEKLYNAKIYLNTPDLFAWTIVIIVISFVFEKCFLGIVSRVVYMIEHK